MIIDTDKLLVDGQYHQEMRHRFETDHFFAALVLGFDKFNREVHQSAVDLYFPKNRNLSIPEQHHIKQRMHLDPRFTFKTTLGRVDDMQWISAFPDIVTILEESSTQPLAAEIGKALHYFCWAGAGKRGRLYRQLYPELVFDGKEPFGKWNTPNHRVESLDLDSTVDYTSPKSPQSGWHPWVLNPDDMVETLNSGIKASEDVRKGVISTYRTNKNTMQAGGFINIRGTRYHPFDLYGDVLSTMDPKRWKVLIRAALTVKDGARLMPGEFPREEDLILHFPMIESLRYAELREKFFDEYESFMCFAAGSRVLMADWTEKRIEEVKVGDEVVGFRKIAGHQTRLTRERVEAIASRTATVAKLITDSGRISYPTFNHRFLRPQNGDLRYLPAKVGTRLVSVYRPSAWPTAVEQRQLDWLGGILDGEGSLTGSLLTVSQQALSNPEVFGSIANTLRALGISFSQGITNKTESFLLHGGRSLRIRLLQQAQMAKRERFTASLWAAKQVGETCGRRGAERNYPRVVSMEPIGEQKVFDIETTSGNFVCDGFAVHNCQLMNDPQGGSVPVFDERKYSASLADEDHLPLVGETIMVLRLPCQSKKFMATHAECAVGRVAGGKVYILDAWRGVYVPSGLCEKVIKTYRLWDCEMLLMEDLPGTDDMPVLIRNEALKRNRSIRIGRLPYEEDDSVRNGRIAQAEPMMTAGRLILSHSVTAAAEMRKQFIHFGLVSENGIVDCISRLLQRVPLSLMRAQLSEEEIQAQLRRRESAQFNHVFQQRGMPVVNEEARQKAQATVVAFERAAEYAMLPPLPGGLDG